MSDVWQIKIGDKVYLLSEIEHWENPNSFRNWMPEKKVILAFNQKRNKVYVKCLYEKEVDLVEIEGIIPEYEWAYNNDVKRKKIKDLISNIRTQQDIALT